MQTNNRIEQQVPEQTQEEVDRKTKLAKIAYDKGEVDHLHPDQSFTGRYSRQLHRIASDAMDENLTPDSKEAQLQSIIGMVHTLVMDGRTTELFSTIKKRFPAYFL